MAITTSSKVKSDSSGKRDAASKLAEHRLSVLELAKDMDAPKNLALSG